MRVACVVLFATSLSLSPMFPLGFEGEDGHHHAGAAGTSQTGLAHAVQEATRPFLEAAAARRAGYAPFLGCVSGQQEGAMGVHYVNGDLVGDGELDPAKPEALMYEMRDGQLSLLGVEYIVPAAAWQAHKHTQPPAMMGQVFTYTGSPNRYGLDPFYALHVWAWRDNPHGTFVDFNPNVSCDGFVPTS
jgi:hypothetical protein